ncbi:hypothetical protein BC830DRAFT_1096134 [Chytriomyces sp. MP71]|nr:hypothetical protein BC830DRAFT_1096134 [Chytriomyces sp. MP71]
MSGNQKRTWALQNLRTLLALTFILYQPISLTWNAYRWTDACSYPRVISNHTNNLIWEWINPVVDTCAEVDESITIIRGIANADIHSRWTTSLDSIAATIKNNPCATLAVVVDQTEFRDKLYHLTQYGPKRLAIYKFGDSPLTFDSFLRVANHSNPNNDRNAVFAISIGDVVLPTIHTIMQSCQFHDNMNLARLFVVSSRSPNESCTQSRENWHWNVFIGKTSTITNHMLQSTVFSPGYRGVENVVSWALTEGQNSQLVNLCPYVDVVQQDAEQLGRISIRWGSNSLVEAKGEAATACNLDILAALSQHDTPL